MSVIQCWHVDGSSDLSASIRLLAVEDLAEGIPADERVVVRSAPALSDLPPPDPQGAAKTTAATAVTAATEAAAAAAFKSGTFSRSSSQPDGLSASKLAVLAPPSMSFLTLHLRSDPCHSHADVLLQSPCVLASLPFLSSLVTFFSPGTMDAAAASSATGGEATQAGATTPGPPSGDRAAAAASAPSWLDCYHVSHPITSMERSQPWVLTSVKPLLVDNVGGMDRDEDGTKIFELDGSGGEMQLEYDGLPLIYVADKKHLRFKNIHIIVSLPWLCRCKKEGWIQPLHLCRLQC